MRDKNALKLLWDRTLKGIFLQLAFCSRSKRVLLELRKGKS